MKMLNDNVLVGDIEVMTTKVGEIFLPDKGMLYGEHGENSSRRYEPEVGTILGLGPKTEGLAVGDRVYLAPLKGKEYKDMKIYKFEEIFGKIVEESFGEYMANEALSGLKKQGDCVHDWSQGLDKNGGKIYYCDKCRYNAENLM